MELLGKERGQREREREREWVGIMCVKGEE